MRINLRPEALLKAMAAAIGLLLLMHLAMLIARFGFNDPGFLKLEAFFDLNREQNVPTLYSTLQLALAAGLLMLLAVEAYPKDRLQAACWAGLGATFAFLMGDEFCAWHEHLIGPMRERLHVGGALSFAWVIPYGAAVCVFAGLYFRFWWRMSPPVRWRVAAAGMLYVGGGIGMEMVGSKLFSVYGWDSLQFNVETMLEEGMEMLGVAFFIYALTLELQSRCGSILISTGRERRDPLVDDAMQAEPIEPRPEKRAA